MTDVVFLAPSYPNEMIQFTRGLREVGARVFGVGDTPAVALPESVKRDLTDYLQVPRILDEADVVARVAAWMRGRDVSDVLANWEPVVLLAARIREHLGIDGMSADTVLGFRDKQLMKERVGGAGLRVPRSARASTVAGVREAAIRVGFPLVVKPIDGAGSANTYRVADDAALAAVLPALRDVAQVSVEEYIDGEEFTYDAICQAGVPVYENVVQYLPKPIESRNNEWISPVQISARDLTQPRLQPGLRLGRDVLKALGMRDGFVHMEWFLTPTGEAVFGEIACRSGGALLVDMMNWTSDIDLYREWARVVCHGDFQGVAPRRYNVGVVFKRAQGQGVVTAITGLGDFLGQHGQWLVEDRLSRPGTPRRNWRQTLLSDGHVAIRHPDWDHARRICEDAATGIKLYAASAR